MERNSTQEFNKINECVVNDSARRFHPTSAWARTPRSAQERLAGMYCCTAFYTESSSILGHQQPTAVPGYKFCCIQHAKYSVFLLSAVFSFGLFKLENVGNCHSDENFSVCARQSVTCQKQLLELLVFTFSWRCLSFINVCINQ